MTDLQRINRVLKDTGLSDETKELLLKFKKILKSKRNYVTKPEVKARKNAYDRAWRRKQKEGK